MAALTDATVCEIADQFSSQFYEAFDKKRHVIGKMYNEGACMVWNGHALSGQEKIAAFLTDLPNSDHKIKSLDAQPVTNPVTQNQRTLLLNSAGNIKFQDRWRCFTQTFIITEIGGFWKIASDRFRFID